MTETLAGSSPQISIEIPISIWRATANASSSASVTILLNDQRGDFRAALPLVMEDSPFDLAAGDLNGDGFVDIVTTNAAATDSLWVWLGNGQGGFSFRERFPSGADPIRVLLADLNGHELLDAISVNGSANQNSLRRRPGEPGRTPGHRSWPDADPQRRSAISIATACST